MIPNVSFDFINDCDIFVFLDEVQYTKQDWRNRNLIRTSSGEKWLTIPVGKNLNKKILEVKLLNYSWQEKHKKSLQMAYGRSKYFNEFEYLLDDILGNDFCIIIYASSPENFISDKLIKKFKTKNINIVGITPEWINPIKTNNSKHLEDLSTDP